MARTPLDAPPRPPKPRSSVRDHRTTQKPASEAPGPFMVTFDVPGDPVPQPRPRIFKNGGVGEDPKATAHKHQTVAAARRVKAPLHHGEVELCVTYFRATRHRVDIDNLLKLTQDALTGTCWLDDAQIVSVQARKVLGAFNPRTEVLVRAYPTAVLADWHQAWEDGTP